MQVSGKKLMIGFGIFGVLTIVTVLVSFRRIGWTRYEANVRLIEGKTNAVNVARAVMLCVEHTGKLPETTPAVPKTLAEVGAKSYRSKPEEWDDPSWRCMGWSLKKEQFFRYQWVKNPDDSGGVVRMEADFDGNGNAEAIYEQVVLCGGTSDGFHCWPGDFHDIASLH